MNGDLLRAQEQFVRADRSQRPAERSNVGTVLYRRAAIMRELMEQNRESFLSLAFSPELSASLAATYPEFAAQIESHGTWEGPAEYFIADDIPTGTSRTIINVRAGAEKLRVFLGGPEPVGLRCGSRLRVQGVRLGTNVAAATATLLPADTAADVDPCSPLGVQKVAVLNVSFPGAPAAGYSNQTLFDAFFGTTGHSLDGFWREASYNQTSASGGVFGPYTLSQSYTCDQYPDILNAAIAAADSDLDFRLYNRIFVVFPNISSCSWSGLSGLGCSALTSPSHGTFTAAASWLVGSYMGNRDLAVMLSSHEGGHGLGLHHSSSRDFGSEPLGPPGAAGTLNEYGDPLATMGYWNFGTYAAPHKALLGWLSSGSGYQSIQSGGTFILPPYETSAGGIEALKVQRGTTGIGNSLWIENRQSLGQYDSTLPSTAFAGALIHYEDSTTGTHTHLLDFTPQSDSYSDAALANNTKWTDPYTDLSLSITPGASNSLAIQVSYGSTPSPCVTNAPILSISPQNPTVTAGGSVAFTLTITNQNSSACAPGGFAISAAAPAGWSSSFSPAVTTLSSGQTGSVTVTESVPSTTAAATYTLALTAAADAATATANVNATVTTAPVACTPANPVLTLSSSSINVTAGGSATYLATVTNQNSAGCATATFSIGATVPSGWTSGINPALLNLDSGQSGAVTIVETVPASSAAATYTSTITATSGAYSRTATATTIVAVPPPTCTPANPVLTVAPGSIAVIAGGSTTYTLSVTNQNSNACSAGAFSISVASPAGWSSTITPSALTLNSAQSGSAAIVLAVPSTTAAGTYMQTLTVNSGTGSATVAANVTVQASPIPGCVRGTPAISFSPATMTASPGSVVSFGITLLNTDSSGCSSQVFAVASSLPDGWTSILTPQTVTLAAGQSAPMTVTKTVPSTIVAGTYGVALTASSDLSRATGWASVTVSGQGPGAQTISVSLSTSASSYSLGATVPITATVVNGGNPVIGATVRFSVVRPDGATDSAVVTSDSAGRAVWNYRLNRNRNAAGAYAASSTATSGSSTASAATIRFTVQ